MSRTPSTGHPTRYDGDGARAGLKLPGAGAPTPQGEAGYRRHRRSDDTTSPQPWLDPDLVRRVREKLLHDPGPVTPARVAAAVRATGQVLGSGALLELVAQLSAELAGAGPLQPLLDDPRTTDVFVNGPHGIWVDRGEGLTRHQLNLGAEADVRALAVRLASSGGRRLDDSSPLVDVRLPGGVRLNAVIPPISGEHTVLSLRVPRAGGFTVADLVASGFIPPPWAGLLHQLISRRINYLISGGTGSGKTALLGALLGLAPASDRIVLVEDAPELAVDHDHVVALAARQKNIEGAGEVTLTALVRNALRMRPDRLVVGECRGEEVRDMLAALNTGHDGGCATIHANAVEDVPARLEALGALAGLSPAAVSAQAGSAFDMVLHLRRHGARRGLVQLGVVVRDRTQTHVVPALWRESPEPAAPLSTGPAAEHLRALLEGGRR
ncbi:TadA family conjugal transfer-associated ATPase [Sediminivirga luteola]|uniref:TadA family conjugal transfer-associated ATPase n=1 Tax=Sediminivirga luteola TaxID=1774748 RepID=UPI001F58E71A|nr:TadA family conjugal transfer-associated ATPase [Sediminivirga luteola]MCI2266124.1 TadA family conjugal transfer-associated ATPase [Sediminivirga luteola]